MSFDLGVWFPHRRLSADEAGALYERLCEGDISGLQRHPAVTAFHAELTARHPEIDDVPEELIGDHDYSPWSCALDVSEAHVIMPCVWSKADDVGAYVQDLAARHGLAVYDPQAEEIIYPDAPQDVGVKRWWRFW